MKYKEPKTYKGFESWFHALQMNAKMYLYIFFILFFIHVFIPLVYMILFKPHILTTVFQVFTGFHVELWPKAVKILFQHGFWVFLLSTPIWLLYPALLARFKHRAKQLMQDQHLRGSKIISDDELRQIIINDIKHRDLKMENLIRIGKITVPPWAETRHFLIVGRPGTGKTTFLNQVLETIRLKKGKAIIHDFKGDYVSRFFDAETDILFNPLDERSVPWCLFSEIAMQPDIDSIAASMIPPSWREDKFWVDAARDVFSSILYYLKTTKQETNRAIWDHVTKTEAEMLELMQTAVAQGIEPAKKALGYLQGYEKGSKVASDVLSTMRQYTNCFQYMTHLESQFSIKQWIESDSGGFIFITNYENLKDTLKPILSLFIDIAMKHLLSQPESMERRIFYILDEFATLQRLTSIVRTLEAGRSKGASVWVALQDISQLQKLYGHETAFTITNTTNTVVTFALNDPNSCEYMSKMFGETEILETDESLLMGPTDYRDGLSITRKRKTERLLLPSQFALLKDFECYLKMLSYDVTKTRIPFKPYKQTAESFVLNERFRL